MGWGDGHFLVHSNYCPVDGVSLPFMPSSVQKTWEYMKVILKQIHQVVLAHN